MNLPSRGRIVVPVIACLLLCLCNSTPPLRQARMSDYVRRTSTISCPSCLTLEDPESASFLNNEESLRKELIKLQILNHLKLKVPPLIRDTSIPPEWQVISKRVFESVVTPEPPSEDQVIVFADDLFRCNGTHRHRNSTCFAFSFDPNLLLKEGLHQAHLWVQSVDAVDGHHPRSHRTFRVTEVSDMYTRSQKSPFRRITISETASWKPDGWLALEVSEWIDRWKQRINEDVFLELTGPKFKITSQKPFIVFKTRQPKEIRRAKRSTETCSSKTSCCRKAIQVNVEEFGWDSWLITPKNFTAYYCKGSCSQQSFNEISSMGNTYEALLLRLRMKKGLSRAEKLDLVPCCSALHTEPMSIIWTNGKHLEKSYFDNFIVTSCGCRG